MKINQYPLDDVFQSNMVLPAFKPIKIGGTVGSKEKVVVSFKRKKYFAKSDSNGDWHVFLNPVTNTNKTEELIIDTQFQHQRLVNIHFGKVYLLSGQSNIEFRLKDEATYKDIINNFTSCDFSNLYYYNVPQIDYYDKHKNLIKPNNIKNEKWHTFSKTNIGNMSAIGFFMLLELKKTNKDIPLAIVDDFKGGTSASAWVSVESLKSNKVLKDHFIKPYEHSIKGKTWNDFEKETEAYNKKVKKHDRDLDIYLKDHPDISLSSAKNIVGHTPWPPPDRPDLFTRPGGLYQTMVQQVKHCSFNSMVWYQGENDTDRAKQYNLLLPLLLNTWRSILGDLSLHIYLIQLPGYEDYPRDSAAVIRQIQLATARTTPGVSLVSFIDGGERHNIHPTHKAKMGSRLGNIISNMSYGSTPYIYKWCKKGRYITLYASNSYRLQLLHETFIEAIDSEGIVHKLLITENNLLKTEIEVSVPKTQ